MSLKLLLLVVISSILISLSHEKKLPLAKKVEMTRSEKVEKALNDFGRVSDALKIKLSLYRKEISKFPNLRAAKLTQELDELQNETVNLQSNFLTNKRENNLETVLSISKKLKKFEIEWKKTAPAKSEISPRDLGQEISDLNKKINQVLAEISDHPDPQSFSDVLIGLKNLHIRLASLDISNTNSVVVLKEIWSISEAFNIISKEWTDVVSEPSPTSSTTFIDTFENTTDLKQQIANLRDKINKIQTEILEQSSPSSYLEISNELETAEKKLSELLKNLSTISSNDAREAIQLVGDSIDAQNQYWDQIKSYYYLPRPPPPIDPLLETRLKLKSEIGESIIVASELKAHIKTSTDDLSKKKFYIATINSAKNLLFLLDTIAEENRINLILKYLFEARDLMQNIILGWNYKNLKPFKLSQDNPPNKIKQNLADLEVLLNRIKLGIRSIAYIEIDTTDLKNRNSQLLDNQDILWVDLLKQGFMNEEKLNELFESSYQLSRDVDIARFIEISSSKPPSPTCPENETYSECVSSCEPSCPISSNEIKACTLECRTGCACEIGLVRNVEGICIKVEECPIPDCKENEHFTFNGCGYGDRTCQDANFTCLSESDRSGCFCDKGFVRNESRVCVHQTTCPNKSCNINEVWSDCGPEDLCEPSCSYYQCSDLISCLKKCVCKKGFIRDSTFKCVPIDSCQQFVIDRA